jgi:hypothetical protein
MLADYHQLSKSLCAMSHHNYLWIESAREQGFVCLADLAKQKFTKPNRHESLSGRRRGEFSQGADCEEAARETHLVGFDRPSDLVWSEPQKTDRFCLAIRAQAGKLPDNA